MLLSSHATSPGVCMNITKGWIIIMKHLNSSGQELLMTYFILKFETRHNIFKTPSVLKERGIHFNIIIHTKIKHFACIWT